MESLYNRFCSSKQNKFLSPSTFIFNPPAETPEYINFDEAVFVLKKLRLPFTLIGGINHNNFMELVKYKPLNLAMINSIWDYEKGPVKSALIFKKILNEEG